MGGGSPSIGRCSSASGVLRPALATSPEGDAAARAPELVRDFVVAFSPVEVSREEIRRLLALAA